MTIETNKHLVATFNSHFEHSELDAALALMADDGHWWVLGKPELFPVTGTKTKEELGETLREVHASLKGGMRMDVVGMVAEGDRVAAELHAHAVTKTGRVYDNRYHMLYIVRDGRIIVGREYTDLMNIRDVFDLPVTPPVGANRQPDGGAAASALGDPLWSGEAREFSGDKRLVADFLRHFAKSDIEAVLRMMTDDATWWVNGRPDLYPGAGTWTKAEMADIWQALYGLLDGGLAMAPIGMTREGDRVAAEVRSHAITIAGKAYDNDYHMMFTVRDGMIAAVREYTDLLHAAEVFA